MPGHRCLGRAENVEQYPKNNTEYMDLKLKPNSSIQVEGARAPDTGLQAPAQAKEVTASDTGRLHGWQLNTHHCLNASVALMQRLEHDVGYVALLQEPYTRGNRLLNIPSNGVAFVGTPRNGERIRAAVIAATSINAWLLPQYSDGDTVTISCDTSVGPIWWCSSYMPGDSTDIPPPTVREVIKHCSDNGITLIVGCDANAHNIVWNSTDTNQRGEALWEYLLTTNMNVCNRGHEPTFVMANRQEVLDLTLATTRNVDVITDWRVDPTSSLSDHRCIRFTACGQVRTLEYYRCLRAADWELFEAESQAELGGMVSEGLALRSRGDIDTAAERICSILEAAMDKACPLKVVRPKGKSKSWWTPELETLKRQAKRTQNQAKRRKTDEAWEVYHQAKRTLKTETRKAKRNAWRVYCSQMNQFSDISRLTKALQVDTHTQLGIIQKEDGTYTNSLKETIEHMMTTLFPGSYPGDGVGKCCSTVLTTAPDTDAEREYITEARVDEAVRSFKSYKSPGGDMVYPIMLQKAGGVLVELLTPLYRSCLRLGYVPKIWRIARVVFLPKNGKKTYHLAKSYRPITLTSFFLKVLERLVYWRLDSGGIFSKLSPFQFAYKPGFSTEAALHNIVGRLEKAVYNKRLALALFIDFEGAFNNISFEAVHQALRKRNIEAPIVTWIMFMLKHQVVTVNKGGVSTSSVITRGTPQGGVLSPLLFNLVMDGLLMNLGRLRALHSQAYADDVALLCTGIDALTIRDQVQAGARLVAEWADKCGLNINCNKSEAIMFTWKRKWSYKPLKLKGTDLPLKTQVTYLGVTIDSKLSWLPHIEMRVTKATRCLAMCRRTVGKLWGLSPRVMYWVYTAMIRPMVSYAAPIWVAGLSRSTAVSRLNRLQRQACVLISSAFPSTPTAALEMLLGLPPLYLFLSGVAASGAYRLKQMGQWRGDHITDTRAHESHINVCNRLCTEIPELNMPGDLCTPRVNLDRSVKVKIEDTPEVAEDTLGRNTIHCYTDGSKLFCGTGAAVHIPGVGDFRRPLGNMTTVFQAEVTAIIGATECTKSRLEERHTQVVKILSDSQAAIKAVCSARITSSLVGECVYSLNALAERAEVHLEWTRAHVGTAGNEAADCLAKQAATDMCIGPEPMLPVAFSNCKRGINDWLERITSRRWSALNTCRQTREMYNTPLGTRGSRILLSLPRVRLRAVLQVITGHGNIRSHCKVMGKCDDDICLYCGMESETREHFVEVCPHFNTRRSMFLDGPFTDLRSLSSNMEFIRLSKYLVETGRLDDFSTYTD